MAHGWSPEFFTQNLLCLSRFPGHGWTCCQDEESWNFLLFLPPYPIYVLSWTLLSWDSENTVSSLSSGRAGVGSEQLGCQCLAHQRHTMKICEFCKVEFFVLIHLVDWPDVEDIPVLFFFFFFRILHGHQNDYINGVVLVSFPSVGFYTQFPNCRDLCKKFTLGLRFLLLSVF